MSPDTDTDGSPARPTVQFELPAPALRPFVACYWHLDATGFGGTDLFLPGLPFAWIFSLGDPGEAVVAGTRTVQPAAFVKGLMGTASHMTSTGGARNYGIAFRAGTAGAFHRRPLPDLAERLTDVAAIGDRELARLAQLVRSASFAEATGLFDRFLRQRLAGAREPGLGRVLLARMNPLEPAATDRLARACRVSPRQLRRLYRDEFGAGPKRVQRIARLRIAADALRLGRQPVAAVAAHCGHPDQAHLAADFRDMIGITATGLAAASTRLAGLFEAFETDRA